MSFNNKQKINYKEEYNKAQGLSHVGMYNCLICNKPIGILLDKRLKNSLPKEQRTLEVCDKCMAKYLKEGVCMIEAEPIKENGKEGFETNGSFAVIKDNAFKQLFPNMEIPEHKRVFVEIGLLQKIGAIK